MCKSSQTLIEGLARNTHYPVARRDLGANRSSCSQGKQTSERVAEAPAYCVSRSFSRVIAALSEASDARAGV
jgi:hypothetical protein